MQHTNNSTFPTTGSYANAASSTPTVDFPTPEQAIIFTAIEGPRIKDYVKAVGDITGPQSIKFVSRISFNRICIFLASVKQVDELLKAHDKITVRETDIPIRRYVTPARRLIISNASPCIPHDTIETALRSAGLKLVSQLTFLRAGIGEEYAHVFSFRRQVYITPLENNETLPSSFVIKYGETNQRVFLTFDEMKCFLCNNPGHIAANCPNITSGDLNLTASSTPATAESLSQINDPEPCTSQEKNTPKQATNEPTLIDLEDPSSKELHQTSESKSNSAEALLPNFGIKQSVKRQNSSNSSSITSLYDISKDIPVKTGQDQQKFTPPLPPKAVQTKKLKRSTSSEMPDFSKHLVQVKQMMEDNPNQYSITFPVLKWFLENTYGQSDPLSIARKLPTDLPALLQTLTEIHPHITDKGIKNRCTRLSKKLINLKQREDGMETASIASQESCSDLELDNISSSDLTTL